MDEEAVKQARILIVDDQEPNVALLERLLDVSDFTNVRSTTDSSQAVTLCAEIDPDPILLDLQMPAPDGFEVMGQLAPWIRGSTRLPILVLTADKTPETKRRALSMGATDFLSKPLDMTEVVLRVNNLLLTRLMQLELRDQNKLLEQLVLVAKLQLHQPGQEQVVDAKHDLGHVERLAEKIRCAHREGAPLRLRCLVGREHENR